MMRRRRKDHGQRELRDEQVEGSSAKSNRQRRRGTARRADRLGKSWLSAMLLAKLFKP